MWILLKYVPQSLTLLTQACLVFSCHVMQSSLSLVSVTSLLFPPLQTLLFWVQYALRLISAQLCQSWLIFLYCAVTCCLLMLILLSMLLCFSACFARNMCFLIYLHRFKRHGPQKHSLTTSSKSTENLIEQWFSNWRPWTHGGPRAGAWASIKNKKVIIIIIL